MSNIDSFRPRGGRSPFDSIRNVEDDGTEWWSARELMPLLGYEKWENFMNAMRRAMASCRNIGINPPDHFREVRKMVDVGSGARRPILDYGLDRVACYQTAMNGDPEKREIAMAQAYFYVQTRRAELELPPPSPPAPPPPPTIVTRPWGERLSKTIQEHRLCVVKGFAPGSFSIYTATMSEILMIEDELIRHGLSLRYGDLADGSMGRRWSDHVKANNWPEPIGQAPLKMPHIIWGNQPAVVPVFVYQANLRPFYDEWLNRTYLPEHMAQYFHRKPEWKDARLSAASAADHASLRLTGQPAAISDRQREALEQAGGFVPVKQLPPPQPPKRLN